MTGEPRRARAPPRLDAPLRDLGGGDAQISPASTRRRTPAARAPGRTAPGTTLDLDERFLERDRRSRYGRSDVIASNASATASIRPSIGISVPGAPRRIAVAVPALVMEEDVRKRGRRATGTPAISHAPSTGCALISASSASSSRPGLASTSWRTLTLPTSCSAAPSLSSSRRVLVPPEPARDRLGVSADAIGVTLE